MEWINQEEEVKYRWKKGNDDLLLSCSKCLEKKPDKKSLRKTPEELFEDEKTYITYMYI